jgi:hypothetical protein
VGTIDDSVVVDGRLTHEVDATGEFVNTPFDFDFPPIAGRVGCALVVRVEFGPRTQVARLVLVLGASDDRECEPQTGERSGTRGLFAMGVTWVGHLPEECGAARLTVQRGRGHGGGGANRRLSGKGCGPGTA